MDGTWRTSIREPVTIRPKPGIVSPTGGRVDPSMVIVSKKGQRKQAPIRRKRRNRGSKRVRRMPGIGR